MRLATGLAQREADDQSEANSWNKAPPPPQKVSAGNARTTPSGVCGSVKFSSVTQSCPTLCDPMDCSMPGFPVHHQLLEFTQTHIHWVGDAIQPSHPAVPFSSLPQSFPASGSFPMSQFFASGGQSTGVSTSASVLPMNTQDWSPLGLTGWITSQSKGLSRVFSYTTVQKHQFSGAQFSLWSSSHICACPHTGQDVRETWCSPSSALQPQGSSAELGGGGPDSGLLHIWHSFPIKPMYASFLTACEWKMQLEFEERPQ